MVINGFSPTESVTKTVLMQKTGENAQKAAETDTVVQPPDSEQKEDAKQKAAEEPSASDQLETVEQPADMTEEPEHLGERASNAE